MNHKLNHNYPECSTCGTQMEAEWFLEDEFRYIDGHCIKTGRVRKNINWFICPCCGQKHPVDDTFAGPWRDK